MSVVASLPSYCPVVFLFFSSCLASFSGPSSTLSCLLIPVSLFLWLVTSCPLFVCHDCMPYVCIHVLNVGGGVVGGGFLNFSVGFGGRI